MIERIKRFILHEPLAHFLALAALLFIFESVWSSGQKETIYVDQQTADFLIQQREELELRKLRPEERQQVIQAFIEDEILYREAYKRGLDKGDTRMRRNLILKMRRLLIGEVSKPTKEELKHYFEANRATYTRPPTLSLQQVFFPDSSKVPDGLLEQLRAGTDPTTVGESFKMYGRSLLRVSSRELAGILGAEAARPIIALEDDQWHGPYESLHGSHFVRILDRQPAHEARFEDVQSYLAGDWSMAQARATIEQEVEYLREGFEVVLEFE